MTFSRLTYREIVILGIVVGLLVAGASVVNAWLFRSPSDVDFMLERADRAIAECPNVSMEALVIATDARAEAVRLRSSDPVASQQAALQAIQALRDDGCLAAEIIIELLPP